MLDVTMGGAGAACDFKQALMSTGFRVGRLVVRGLNRNEDVVCDCDCGETTAVEQEIWLTGNRYQCDSCDLWLTWSPARQIIADDDTYQILVSRARGAMDRCRNPENENYPAYGGRGIRFLYRDEDCFALDLWLKGFRAGDPRTTDRIDVDGHYEPENVRLAHATEQVRNRRISVVVDTPSGPVPLADLAELHGISPETAGYAALARHAARARKNAYEAVMDKIGEISGGGR